MGFNWALCGGVSCCVVLIVSAILIGVSFSSLEPNEVGLDYNHNNQQIDTTTLYQSGRYFLGLGHGFIVYPKTLQSVKFITGQSGLNGPIDGRTSDGLAVRMDIAFNFKLLPTVSDISQLYLDYGEMDSVSTTYNRVARNWVRVVASNFTAFEFFYNRTQIQEAMAVVLDEQLRKVHASVDSLQLLSLDMPSAFDSARTAQETAVQEISQAQSEYAVAAIQAETSVLQETKKAEVILLNAQSQATSITLSTEAAVAAFQAKLNTDMKSYKAIKQRLGLSTEQLLSYIWLNAVDSGVNGSFVALDRPKNV